MVNENKVVVEAEVIESSGPNKEQFKNYTAYTKKPQDSSLVGVWLLCVFSIFFSLVPIFGLAIAVIALITCIIKKVPPILPILSIIIGTISTGIFLFIWLVIKAIINI